MINENVKIVGKISIKLNGVVTYEKDNLVVTAGKAFLATAMVSGTASPFTHMGIGTGSTAAVVGNTDLETSTVRQVFDSATPVSNVVTFITTYAPGVGTATITEAGLFNAASAGTMFSRVVFTGIAKGALDSLQITWTVTLG